MSRFQAVLMQPAS